MSDLIPIKPLELMLDSKVTNSDFTDFVGVWDNFMPEGICNRYIEWYNTLEQEADVITAQMDDGKVGDGRLQFDNSHLGRYDKQFLINHNHPTLQNITLQYLKSITEHYVWRYPQLLTQNMMSTAIKFQHTPEGGGYHVWHYESMGLDHSPRVLVWMIYLNDVEDGGETEFYDQKRRIKPTRGTVLMWPAGFTHVHKGNTVLSGDKYILTGWYLLNGS
tara:strand:- start:92 stop:745 length:654 start_codon:yes stop_codon:yes gene_type:complete